MWLKILYAKSEQTCWTLKRDEKAPHPQIFFLFPHINLANLIFCQNNVPNNNTTELWFLHYLFGAIMLDLLSFTIKEHVDSTNNGCVTLIDTQ